jgi:hypothetical protein
MATRTKSVAWPYAVKSIAIDSFQCFPYPVFMQGTLNVISGEYALEIYPPYAIYQPVALFMHLRYTFNAAISPVNQVLQGIYVRDTTSSVIAPLYGSSIQNYMPLNMTATSNIIDISLDLTSLLTGLATNVVFLHFNQNIAGGGSARGGYSNSDTMNVWKLDLIYQTIGIRNEK